MRFWILGAVFLCTTGAEALYSDLGTLREKKYSYFLDFCKNMPAFKLPGTGSLFTVSP